MRSYPAVVLSTGALLLLAACGGGASPTPASSPAASSPPTQAASPTTAPTESASTEASAAPTPTADDSTASVCFPGDMPDLNSGWKFLQAADGTFALAYPDDWEDLSGEVDFTTRTLLDEQTFAELGLASDASIKSDFVRMPVGIPNLSVFHFGAVESSAAEIRAREVARYGALADVEEILDDAIEACVGGTVAAGLAMAFNSSDGNTYYQQNLFAVRNGELYAVQWLDRVDPDTELLADMLTTWGWVGG